MADCSSDGSTSFFTPKMRYELQSGVDDGSWSRNEIDGNLSRLANETDEISSSAIKAEPLESLNDAQIKAEPLESLNDAQIKAADSNTKTGGIKSEPTPAEREGKTKQYERYKRYREKMQRDKIAMSKLLERAQRKRDEMIVQLKRLREANQMVKELHAELDRFIWQGCLILEDKRSEEEGLRRVHRQQLKTQCSTLQIETGPRILGTNSESVDTFSPRELATAHSISNDDAIRADILVRLEVDDESKVKLSDFSDLGGERIPVGKYSFPPSLCQTVENITEVHGDVSTTTKMNLSIAEGIYIMLCASIKEMSGLRLEQVTENLILKWRDAIKDALRINFNVDFAMKHLKKVARAYIGLMERRKLANMASKISNLEAQLSSRKAEHSKISEMSKEYMDVAEEFSGKAVSWGMF